MFSSLIDICFGVVGAGALVEGFAADGVIGSPPREGLPALDDHIHVSGAEFETAAGAARHLGRDHACPRAEERVIDRLAGPAVVFDRPAHALDRLLGAVPPALLALAVAERVVVGNLPDRGLGAVARPLAGRSFPDGVPARFVLPVVIS